MTFLKVGENEIEQNQLLKSRHDFISCMLMHLHNIFPSKGWRLQTLQ